MRILGNVVVRLKILIAVLQMLTNNELTDYMNKKKYLGTKIKVSFQIVYKFPPGIVKQSRNVENGGELFQQKQYPMQVFIQQLLSIKGNRFSP